MKKTLLALGLFLVAAATVSCHSGKREQSRDTEKKSENVLAKKDNVGEMKDVTVNADNSEINMYAEGNPEYRKLMSIAEKCDEPDFNLNMLSQSDYAFMIKFCHSAMDAAEEADRSGQSDQFMAEYSDMLSLVEPFCTLLSMAYQEGLLSDTNQSGFDYLMNRASDAVAQ